jgi:hypothetical protein
MAFQLIRHDEPLPPRNLIILLFGEPGVSKTSLSFTAADPVLFGFDAKGLDRAINRKDAIKFDRWSDFLEYMDSDEIERNKYKTAIFDTGGTMLDDFLAPYVVSINEKYGNGMGGLGLSGYGVMKDAASKIFVKAEQKGLDLIFICHTETEKEGDNMIRVPKMTGGARDILVAKADLIGYMEMRNNKITLEFSPTSRHAGKNCARFPILEIPHFEKDAAKFNTFMADVIKQTKDHMSKVNEAQAKAVKLVAEYKQTIASADAIEKLEAVFPQIEALSPVYKAQVTQFFGKRYAEIWGGVHMTDQVKTPEQFKKLSVDMKLLPESVKKELIDPYRKLVESAGLVYNKELDKFIPKGAAPVQAQTPPVQTPVQTPPASTEKEPAENKTPPAAAAATTPKDKKEKKEKKEEKPPAPPAKVKHDEKWFMDRVGTTVEAKSNKFNGPMKITDRAHAAHLHSVSQHSGGYEFFDVQEPPAEKSIQQQFDEQPDPETSHVSSEAEGATV